MRRLIIAAAIFISVVLVASLVTSTSDDGGGDKAPAESTTTTQPEDTPSTTDSSSGSTTSTTEASTTTSTPSDDDAEECGEGFFGSLTCATPAPDPGDVTPSDTEECEVDRLRPVYDFDLPGKLAPENFTVAYNSQLLRTESGRVAFLKDQLALTCRDPVAMASYASYTGITPTIRTDADMNRLVRKYLNESGTWQRHHDALVKMWKRIKGTNVKQRDPEEVAKTHAQKRVGNKRPPQLYTEPVKDGGSCDIIIELVFDDGTVLRFCPGCKQPYMPETPEPSPATPTTSRPRPRPPCTTCTTTTTRPRGNPTTTTAPPTPTTTTTRPTTPTTRPVVLCPEGPNAGKPAPNGDLSQCLKSTGGGTPGD